MAYLFEWDPKKAAANLRAHGVSFEEATEVFGDPLALNMPDPDHSASEERYLILGARSAGVLSCSATPCIISSRGSRP